MAANWLDILTEWLTDLGQWLQAATVLGVALTFRRLPPSIRWLGGYLALNLVVLIWADWLWQQSKNNLWLLHINTGLELVFFSLFFREVYLSQAWFKRAVLGLLLVAVPLLVLNSLWWEPYTGFNSVAKALVQTLIIGYVILYFFDAFGKVDITRGEARSISLVCYATLLCYAGSLLIFLFAQLYNTDDKVVAYDGLWTINAMLSFLFQVICLLAIALLIGYIYRNPRERRPRRDRIAIE